MSKFAKILAVTFAMSLVGTAAWAGETKQGEAACDKSTKSAEACAASCASKTTVEGKGGDNTTAKKDDHSSHDHAAKAAPASYTLGQKVESFEASEGATGAKKSLADVAGTNATVVVFWNKDCPYVEGAKGAAKDVEAFAKEYKDKGVNVVAIDAGVNNTPEALAAYAKERNLPFTFLVNQDSKIAAAFNAQYTPHAFVLDKDHKLVYRGAFVTGSGEDRKVPIKDAVEEVLAGKPVTKAEVKGTGCSLKYAEGAKPKEEAKPKA